MLALACPDPLPAGGGADAHRASGRRLAHVVAEVEGLRDEWGADVLLPPAASKQALLARLRGAARLAVLHLAAHGVTDDHEPERSGVNLGEGVWHASEVLSRPVPADLVTLSCCVRGGGAILRGEGVIALHRAFLLARVRSVCASGWEIPDADTRRLMRHFYRGLEGASASVALQHAMAAMAADPDAHPWTWAGFSVFGA
jgi:CHAT domain-containing protein